MILVKWEFANFLFLFIQVYFLYLMKYNRRNKENFISQELKGGVYMNLAKVSANGQITVPVEVRRQLGLKSGDKILFLQNQNGEIVVSNASAAAIRKAQAAFAGVSETMGISSEDDIQALVDEVRYGEDR